MLLALIIILVVIGILILNLRSRPS